MKILSIKQPYAWLIIQGQKDIENRPWKTGHRGPFLIHASKKINIAAYNHLKKTINLPDIDDLWTGGIIGQAEIINCVDQDLSPWFLGPFGFKLKNAKPLPFYACKGKLNFFNLPDYS